MHDYAGLRPLPGLGIELPGRLLELRHPGLHKELGNSVYRLIRGVVHRLVEVGTVQHRTNVDTDRTAPCA
jgi:hypothetical protein